MPERARTRLAERRPARHAGSWSPVRPPPSRPPDSESSAGTWSPGPVALRCRERLRALGFPEGSARGTPTPRARRGRVGLWRCWCCSALRCRGSALCSSAAGGTWSAASGPGSSGARARPGVGHGLFSARLKELDVFLCQLPWKGFGVGDFRGRFRRHRFCDSVRGQRRG